MTSNIIDPAIEKMIDQINKKGFKGKISPGLVLNLPKDVMEPLVVEGKTDKEIADIHDVSASSVFYLRKFYELPGAREVKKMLACVEVDWDMPIEVGPDEVLEIEVKLNNDGTLAEVESITGKIEKMVPDDTRHNVTELGEEVAMTINERRVKDGLEPIKEMNIMQTYEPPLLDIEGEADTITPLLQGIAKHLEKRGSQLVQVTVVVRRVG